MLEELLQSNSESLTLDKSWFPVGDYLFYRVQLDLVPTGDEGTQTQELHELIYGTIINGYALNFHLFGNADPIEPEEARALEELVGSIQFTQVLDKPEADMANLRNSLLLLGLMLAAVVAPLIYVPLKNKSDKKKKAQLAEQLSEYHKTHGPNEVEGQPLFANDTDCTKEAIHHFSMYQALVKNMGELIFGALTCVIMVSAAFLIDSEWWMKLAAVAVSGYYAYKLAFMPTSIEKIQRKVYGRGPSQTAHYVFYPEAFRVSGIQAASVVPLPLLWPGQRLHGGPVRLHPGRGGRIRPLHWGEDAEAKIKREASALKATGGAGFFYVKFSVFAKYFSKNDDY